MFCFTTGPKTMRPSDHELKLLTLNQNKHFFLLNCLSKVFCHKNRNLTNTKPFLFYLSLSLCTHTHTKREREGEREREREREREQISIGSETKNRYLEGQK
jgi:hypothetical protein